MTEINVMIERNVRFGFKYRSAKKRLKASFNSSLAWRQTQPDSNASGSEEVLLGFSYGVRLQFFQCDEFKRGSMRRFQIHRRSSVVIKGALPARNTHAPFVTGF